MQITVTHDDGTTADITAGVLVAYDTAYHSMDWGSGFLDLEEMEAIAALAEACRFPSFEEALRAVQRAREEQEKQLTFRAQQEAARREREEARALAVKEIAAEMREREPKLAEAGWTDEQLYTLHVMRNEGRA